MPNRLIVFLVAAWLAPSVAAKELWKYPWVEVKSPHFRVLTTTAPDQAVSLVNDLEAFRVALEMTTTIGRFDERIPTTVYVLPRADRKLGVHGSLVGYFLGEMRANFAVARMRTAIQLDDVLKHEYIHFLVRNRDDLLYPTWFDEGYAEVLQTITVRERTLEYAKPLAMRVDWLNTAPWLPFEKVLEAQGVEGLPANHKAMFYAQSWLLVHYLMFGPDSSEFAVRNARFLDLIETDVQPMAAFEQAFGIPRAKLRARVLDYGARDLRIVRATLKEPIPLPSTTTASVSVDQIAAELGMLALVLNEADEAKRYWDAAFALNSSNLTALIGLGDVLKFDERFDEAWPFYEKALALAPDDAIVHLDTAEYFLDRAQAATDPDVRLEDLKIARRHFARSYRLNPELPETLAMNGRSYVMTGEFGKALESLQAAHEMLPSSLEIRAMLAEAHAGAGNRAEAISLLRSIVAWTHAEGETEARKRLDELLAAEGGSGAPVAQ